MGDTVRVMGEGLVGGKGGGGHCKGQAGFWLVTWGTRGQGELRWGGAPE